MRVEVGDATVSMDLLIRFLLALGIFERTWFAPSRNLDAALPDDRSRKEPGEDWVPRREREGWGVCHRRNILARNAPNQALPGGERGKTLRLLEGSFALLGVWVKSAPDAPLNARCPVSVTSWTPPFDTSKSR